MDTNEFIMRVLNLFQICGDYDLVMMKSWLK